MSPGFNVQTAGVTTPVVAVPTVTGSTITNRDAAIRLGKALFWDTQTGSDGQMACASCHFHAGADNRTRNTIHPGDTTFAGAGATAPGQTITFVSFNATTVNDRVGSSGVLSKSFGSISTDLSSAVDLCADVTPVTGTGATDASQAMMFSAGERLVTGRNTPPVIGAVFNNDNFWDGRAKNGFNGFSPIGANDSAHPNALMDNSSLASQSVGPPLSNVEMSCAGRAWNGANSLGAKMVVRTPLKNQLVDPTDSVLGPLSNAPSTGLKCGFADRLCTYADLIAAAFGTGTTDSYIANFSTIWGQAVQAYESTLIADRTPYDLGTLTPNQQTGLATFRSTGAKCSQCHVEPEFTDAAVRVANVPNPDGADVGFHNIGVSNEAEDLGRGNSPGPHGTQPGNNGAFKTSSLRNVGLTAPYMHDGRFANLTDVVNFYHNAGGATVQIQNANISSLVANGSANVGGGAVTNLVEFLQNGLTDCRVEHELAPFDHPALALPNGNPDGTSSTLPARGAAGDGFLSCP